MIGKTIENRYTVTGLIGEGFTGTVYRAIDLNSQNPVAIKALKGQRISSHIAELIRFKNEAMTISRLHHPAIVKILEIIDTPQAPIIVMEYIEGQSLHERLAKVGRLSPDSAITIVIGICQALEHVHAAGFIHRDLKPGNILLRKGDGIALIDFGLTAIKDFSASMETVSDGDSTAGSDMVVGSFGYIAPEQIQMAQESIDERSDLYSLGVIFYRMLTGRLPFGGATVSAMIHQHLAQLPEHPSRQFPDIPAIIDRIVLKLLTKDPDQRYQSAAGLRRDLLRYQNGDQSFLPGLDDRIARLTYKTGIVGRDRELQLLVKLFETSLSGTGCMCMVNGEAGMGKTLIIAELRRTVFMRDTAFISGTCFAGDTKTPYGPFAEAVDRYLRRYANHTGKKKRDIANKIKKAVGDLGSILLDLNPMLTDIIETPRPLVRLKSDREQRRFLSTIADFLIALAAAEGGMIITIDDLHWADDGSLALIAELSRRIAQSSLFLIGTYRASEIGHRHGLRDIITRGGSSQYSPHLVTLGPFSADDTLRYCARLFAKSIDDPFMKTLGEFVYHKCRGNPFFAREIIKNLVDEKTISAGQSGELLFDADKLAHTTIPDTIVDILMRRTAAIDDAERELLSCAAIIGRSFSITFLRSLLSPLMQDEGLKTDEEIVTAIDHAIAMGLLEEDPRRNGNISFTHDTIREVFLAEIATDRRQELHARIARTIEEQHADEIERNSHDFPALFDLAHHYINAGDHEKALRYAWPAGQKASRNHAYEEALGYLSRALAIAEELREELLRPKIIRAIGDIHAATGRHDEAIEIYTALLPAVGTAMEQADLHQQMSAVFYKKGDWKSCEAQARMALALLGESLPQSRIGLFMSIAWELSCHLLLRWLPGIAKNRDPQRSRSIVWINYSLSWMYVLDDSLKFVRSVLRMMHVAGRRLGPSRELGAALALYAALCSTMHRFRRSMIYHALALKLREDLADDWGIAQSYQIMGYCYYFNGRFDESVQYYQQAIIRFRKIGDQKEIENSLSGQIWSYILLADYRNLKTSIEQFQDIAVRTGDDFNLCYALFYQGTYYGYIGDYARAAELQEQAYRLSLEKKLWGIHCMVNADIGKCAREQGDIDRALAAYERVKEIYESHNLIRETAYFYFDLADAYIDDFLRRDEWRDSEKRAYLKKIKKACRDALVQTGSSIIMTGSALRVFARYHALTGNGKKAERYYYRSIELLRQINYRLELGRSLLEFGTFLTATGRSEKGRSSIGDAYGIFTRIGAGPYASRARELLGIAESTEAPSLRLLYAKIKTDQKIAAIIGLIKDMSLDMSMTTVLDKALGMVLEISGAGRGYVILKKDNDDLDIVASKNVNRQEGPQFSSTLVRRTFSLGTAILTTNAEEESEYSEFASVAFRDLKSIISIPIKYQNQTIGVCYLDNPFSTGVFSEEDIETVQIIMDQISVIIHLSLVRQNVDRLIELEPDDDFTTKYGITRREREVLSRIIKGETRKDIADSLGITPLTANDHVKNIYAKTSVSSRAELIELLRQHAIGTRSV